MPGIRNGSDGERELQERYGTEERAQRFYRKHGFGVVGTRTFALGATVENDDVMDRRL